MTVIESYLFLLSDSFFSSLILTSGSDFVVRLMVLLAGYNLFFIFTICLCGSMIGALANWQIGRYCLFLYHTDFFKKKNKEIDQAQAKWDRFLIYILLFAWMGVVGAAFSVLAGFFKTNATKFVMLVGIGKAIFYALLIFADVDLARW